jgi:hypothetical protein
MQEESNRETKTQVNFTFLPLLRLAAGALLLRGREVAVVRGVSLPTIPERQERVDGGQIRHAAALLHLHGELVLRLTRLLRAGDAHVRAEEPEAHRRLLLPPFLLLIRPPLLHCPPRVCCAVAVYCNLDGNGLDAWLVWMIESAQ